VRSAMAQKERTRCHLLLAWQILQMVILSSIDGTFSIVNGSNLNIPEFVLILSLLPVEQQFCSFYSLLQLARAFFF
jgi:hypothetical protein